MIVPLTLHRPVGWSMQELEDYRKKCKAEAEKEQKKVITAVLECAPLLLGQD